MAARTGRTTPSQYAQGYQDAMREILEIWDERGAAAAREYIADAVG